MNRFRIVEATLTAELAKPYAYGNPAQSDCFFMGLALVDALEGSQLARTYAGCYSTLAGAQRALRRRGYATLVSFFSAALNRSEKGGAEARFGDLVILRLDDGAEHVGVCLGTRFRTKAPAGARDYSLDSVVAAFHIG